MHIDVIDGYFIQLVPLFCCGRQQQWIDGGNGGGWPQCSDSGG